MRKETGTAGGQEIGSGDPAAEQLPCCQPHISAMPPHLPHFSGPNSPGPRKETSGDHPWSSAALRHPCSLQPYMCSQARVHTQPWVGCMNIPGDEQQSTNHTLSTHRHGHTGTCTHKYTHVHPLELSKSQPRLLCGLSSDTPCPSWVLFLFSGCCSLV